MGESRQEFVDKYSNGDPFLAAVLADPEGVANQWLEEIDAALLCPALLEPETEQRFKRMREDLLKVKDEMRLVRAGDPDAIAKAMWEGSDDE